MKDNQDIDSLDTMLSQSHGKMYIYIPAGQVEV